MQEDNNQDYKQSLNHINWEGWVDRNAGILGRIFFLVIGAIVIYTFLRDLPNYDWRTVVIPIGIIGLLGMAAVIGKWTNNDLILSVVGWTSVGGVVGFLWGASTNYDWDPFAWSIYSFMFQIIAGRPAGGWFESAIGGAILIGVVAGIFRWLIRGSID